MRPFFADRLARLFESGFRVEPAMLRDEDLMPAAFLEAMTAGLGLLSPLLVTVVVAAIVGAVGFGGWTFSAQPLVPNFSKLDPLEGIKRVFGINGLMELAKALAKFLLVAVFAALLLWNLAEDLLGLGRLPIATALTRSASLCAISFVALSATLSIIAAFDVPAQWWQFQRRMRMSRQEIKDELKETEGRPEVRARIRSVQQELATRRMMEEVRHADVVATNPSHFAVALRYDAARMRAPRVVAKGADLVALNIRTVARAHGVPIFEHPLLARALYHTTAIGMDIPPRLYMAVAQVLTYVFQLRDGQRPRGRTPHKPEIDIDPEIFDERPATRGRRRMAVDA
jgi:flagellar biosynthetic protein FlhB